MSKSESVPEPETKPEIPEMKPRSIRLGKDQRAKFLAEYETNPEGELSDPNYYVIKDKNGKLQVRRKRMKKGKSESSEESVHEEPKEEFPKMKTTHKDKIL